MEEIEEDLINEAKERAWVNSAEHLLLKLDSGERVLVKGGPGGITFDVKGPTDNPPLQMRIEGREVKIVWIFWHTHPTVTGPSGGDLKALAILGQSESIIFEIGEPSGTRIRPKSKTELD